MIKWKGVEYCKQKLMNLTSFEANDESESFSSMVGAPFRHICDEIFQ